MKEPTHPRGCSSSRGCVPRGWRGNVPSAHPPTQPYYGGEPPSTPTHAPKRGAAPWNRGAEWWGGGGEGEQPPTQSPPHPHPQPSGSRGHVLTARSAHGEERKRESL